MDYRADLARTVRFAVARLRTVDESVAEQRPAPGKWCAKEVIGHLVDSAANNHQRFVRIRWQDDMVFPGYAQEEWVQAQDYVSAPWTELLDLWVSYNLHLARVMTGIPDEVRFRPRDRHNLAQLAWQTVPNDQPATLDYFMADYVNHLKHHLRQIERLGVLPGSLLPDA